MTITLTREEAQQVLSELEGEIPFYSENDCSTPEWITDAIELLRTRLSAPQPEYRDVVIKGDLWRIEFLPDHAASVVLVRANYEAQPEPEPVAWIPIEHKYPTTKPLDILMADGSILRGVFPQFDGDLWWEGSGTGEKFINPEYADITHWRIHSYTAPPQREWHGLTDEELNEIYNQDGLIYKPLKFYRAIEAKLKEKNT
jgi:hypothetical protein